MSSSKYVNNLMGSSDKISEDLQERVSTEHAYNAFLTAKKFYDVSAHRIITGEVTKDKILFSVISIEGENGSLDDNAVDLYRFTVMVKSDPTTGEVVGLMFEPAFSLLSSKTEQE